jgi:hypothetical protein
MIHLGSFLVAGQQVTKANGTKHGSLWNSEDRYKRKRISANFLTVKFFLCHSNLTLIRARTAYDLDS